MAEASTQCGEVLHSSTRWHVRHGPKEYIILLYAVIVWLGGRSHWKRGSVSSLSLNPTVLILTFFSFTGTPGSKLGPQSSLKKLTAGKKPAPTRVRPQLLFICLLNMSQPEFQLIPSSSNTLCSRFLPSLEGSCHQISFSWHCDSLALGQMKTLLQQVPLLG